VSDDQWGPNPIKLKNPFRLNPECYWYVKSEIFRYIEMFMDHIDFDLKPWDIEDPETGQKEIYIQDKNVLRKMYKLKHIYENQQRQQSQNQQRLNSNNWNFGSIPKQLLKKP
jgi:hypothetical protein